MRYECVRFGERTNERSVQAKPAWQAIGQAIDLIGAPNRIRTGVTALRGPCPGPLDEGSVIEGGSRIERGSICAAFTLPSGTLKT